MSRTVILRPEALADLISARDWYEERQPELGFRFLDAVDHSIHRISTAAEAHERVIGMARRIKVQQFPYVIYFHDLSDRIEVLAVLHGRQNEKAWRDRL